MTDKNLPEENDYTTTNYNPVLSSTEDFDETSISSHTIIENNQITTNTSGAIVRSHEIEDINTNKPWRQIIKRRYVDG